MNNPRKYLYGRCTLSIGAERHKDVHCYLDLDTQRFICEVEQLHGFGAFHATSLDMSYSVSEIDLWGPGTRLKAARIPALIPMSIGGGSWSVTQTPLRHTLGLHPQVGHISFVTNEPILFELNDEDDEVLLKPGLDTTGPVDLPLNLRLSGTKESISILGKTDIDLKDLSIATALAIGCPCRVIAQQMGKKLTLYLGDFKAQGVARPLFYRGSSVVASELQNTGVSSMFGLTLEYLATLSKEEAASFRNSVYTFLQARSVPSLFELQLYAAFHFLEWFDGSRTLSPNVLVNRLGITRKEADAINNIRNALAHNNKDLDDVVGAEASRLFLDSGLRAFKFRGRGVKLDFLNFLFSLLGEQLLRLIGYTGRADTFLPLVGER